MIINKNQQIKGNLVIEMLIFLFGPEDLICGNRDSIAWIDALQRQSNIVHNFTVDVQPQPRLLLSR